MRLKLINEDVTDRMAQNLAFIATDYFKSYMGTYEKMIDLTRVTVQNYKKILEDIFSFLESFHAEIVDSDTGLPLEMVKTDDIVEMRELKNKIKEIVRKSGLDRRSVIFLTLKDALYKLEGLETTVEKQVIGSGESFNKAKLMMGLRAAVKNHLSHAYAVKSIRDGYNYVRWSSYNSSPYASQYDAALRKVLTTLRAAGYKVVYGPNVEIRSSDETPDVRYSKYYTFDLNYYYERDFGRVKDIIYNLDSLLQKLSEVASMSGDAYVVRIPAALKSLMMGNDNMIISSGDKDMLQEYDAIVQRWIEYFDIKSEARTVRGDEGFDIVAGETKQYISYIDILSAAIANVLESEKEKFVMMDNRKQITYVKDLIANCGKMDQKQLLELSKVYTDDEVRGTVKDIRGGKPPVIGKPYKGKDYEGFSVTTGKVVMVSQVDDEIFRFRTEDGIIYDVLISE